MTVKAYRFPDYISGGGTATPDAGIKGRAPAKVTSGTVVSKPLFNYLHWTLPDDPVLTSIGIFRAARTGSEVFPGGSPLYVIGKDNHYKDQDPATITGVFHYWIVTYDKYGNPNPITVANAADLGFV